MSRLPSLFVTGTGTNVGKTVVTALLVNLYRNQDVAAAPFKPVAAGVASIDGLPAWADISFLAGCSGMHEEEVGLYRLKKALSPHLAAADEGIEIDVAAIAAKALSLRVKYGTVLVEGAGGIMAPVSSTETFLDVAERLDLPVLVVTNPWLGTLNHTLLTVSACRERGLQLAGLVINRCAANPDEVEQRNIAELEKLTNIPVVGLIPEMNAPFDDLDDLSGAALKEYAAAIDLSRLNLDKRAGYAEAIAADQNHVWHPFSPMLEYLNEKPHPLMIVAADGSQLVDSDGQRFIDGTASLWVNVHGHRRPELDGAIRDQLRRVAHTTLLGLANEPSALLARELASITPAGLERVFFSDNGSTAVEVGLKVALQYWSQTGHPEKNEFVSFVNAYHGDTLGAVSVGGMDIFHTIFKPLLFKAHLAPAAYCYRCPENLEFPGCGYGCLAGLQKTLAERKGKVAAVIVEPLVQGAAGLLVQPPGYLKEISRLCRQHGALLIADEVATGFGRTGTLFACEREGIRPDIMALAKGITGGYLPLAATLFKEEIYEAFLGRFEELKTFFHGHTYTGNPLACAAALANIKLIKDPQFLRMVNERSVLLQNLVDPINDLKSVGDVRHLGLMAGIELVQDKKTREPFPVEERVARQVILKAREKGVIIRPLGDTVVIMPSLAISKTELNELVETTAWAIAEITEK